MKHWCDSRSSSDKFKSRQLSKEYAVVYTDATCMALRRDTVAKEAQLVLLLKAQKRFYDTL
mgnify:CR=1 FL=1|uniref:hypothetical protein n=1 Tax=Faecalibacillus faecis TaxID=1982628 RepID=UPI0022E77EB5|nr:hypothetical protein [Faecalibacillus faecis]